MLISLVRYGCTIYVNIWLWMQYGKLQTNRDCHEWCRIVSMANYASSPRMCDLGISFEADYKLHFCFSKPVPHCLTEVSLIPPCDRILLQMTFADLYRWSIKELRQECLGLSVIAYFHFVSVNQFLTVWLTSVWYHHVTGYSSRWPLLTSIDGPSRSYVRSV